jgi:choline dehydrogenase-like flavoprotein
VLDAALERARALLRVSNTQFPDSPIAGPLEAILTEVFAPGRTPGREIGPMPMALIREGGLVKRSGPDVILDRLLSRPTAQFELRPETVCRRILMDGNRAVGAELAGPDGASYRVGGRFVVAAADSLHTPQLLFASGIRPRALGHFLNEHPQVSSLAIFEKMPAVADAEAVLDRAGGILADRSVTALISSGVTWIPYDGEKFPFHVQMAQTDPASLTPAERQAAGENPVLSVSFFLASEIVFDNAVSFSETETDWLGRPKMSIRYRLTDRDRARMKLAAETWHRIADAIGRPLPGHAPRTPPNGSSLHYQGTMRMGASNDGTSVCDNRCRVWDTENLYVAGNGLIPTETAGNPTVTSVALAIHAAGDIVARLGSRAAVQAELQSA